MGKVEKVVKYQKGITGYNLKDLTEIQAEEKGRILHKAWKEFHQEIKDKNRKKLEKRLDKLNSI